jgi:hypothetical protein
MSHEQKRDESTAQPVADASPAQSSASMDRVTAFDHFMEMACVRHELSKIHEELQRSTLRTETIKTKLEHIKDIYAVDVVVTGICAVLLGWAVLRR